MADHRVNRPKLEVLQGSRIDPEDVEDTAEELEAYSRRLYGNIRTVQESYPLEVNLDQTILKLRNGMDILAHVAEDGGQTGIVEETEQTARSYIENGYFDDPKSTFRSLVQSDILALQLLNEAMFDSHSNEYAIKFQSAAWNNQSTREALMDGIAHASSIVGLLCPKKEGEDDLEYRRRLVAFIPDACAAIESNAAKIKF